MNSLLRQARLKRNWRQQDLAEQLETTTTSVKRWERGSQQPSSYFRAKLCALFDKSLTELGLAEEKYPEAFSLWTIPFPRNPHFTGRDELLEQLAQHFSPAGSEDPIDPQGAVLGQPEAIKGLGGIGKTQIAVEYAYRARAQARYTHTLWIYAVNEETILSSFVALAQLLPASVVRDEKDPHKLAAAVIRWLELCQDPWLLIVDNADDVALVQPYLPTQGWGNILLTTRAQAVAAVASSLEVAAMGVMEGTQFLLHRTQKLAATDDEHNEAANVVLALDGFPLALDQAGAYIEETGCSFANYLHLYHHRRHELLSRRGIQATRYPDSVATTWSLSFQQVEQKNPASADLLRLCAFLSPDHIPEELLRKGAAYWPETLREAGSDLFAFNQMLEELLKFSLIKRLVEEHTLSIHRLVQNVQREKMDRHEQEHWALCAVSATNAVFPEPEEITTWPQCQRYLEQVQACDVLTRQYELGISDAADLFCRAGTYLGEHAFYLQAESLFQQAFQIRERSLGSKHIQCAEPLCKLAEVYRKQGRSTEAEELLLRALQLCEQQLGPDYRLTASPLDNQTSLHSASALSGLASIYSAQGKYTEAEALFLRTLHILEQHLGPDHLLLAYPLNDLAILYKEQDKYTEAEALFLRTLHIREQHLGPDHLLLAYPLNNLGNLYQIQEKYGQAGAYFLRALYIREQHLGPDHPLLAYVLINLGGLYLTQGRYEQAERRSLRALRILEQRLGSEHGMVAYPLTNLGELYFAQGKHEQAEHCLLRALRIVEQQPGLEHPQVAYLLNALASLFSSQRKYEQAEILYKQALSIRERQLGDMHPDTQQSREAYNSLLHEMGQVYQIQE